MVLVGEMIDGDGFGMDDVVDGDAIVFFLDAKEFLFCRFATRACFRFSLRLLRFGILTHDWFQEIRGNWQNLKAVSILCWRNHSCCPLKTKIPKIQHIR